ncbi:MAG: S8 family peptidase [Cognatishimia activa]
MKTIRKFSILAPAAFSLAACGGGSGGTTDLGALIFGSSFVQSWTAFDTAATNLLATAKYTIQNNIISIDTNGDLTPDVSVNTNSILHSGIHYAHAAGLTGQGQVIAVSDAGFLTTHEAIADDLIDIQAGLPVDSHGTAVASIITGNSSTMIGVAPDADLIVGHWDTTDLTDTGQKAIAARAVAWNNSWGYVDPSTRQNSVANTTWYNNIFGNAAGATYLQTLKDYSKIGNVIFAISNDRTISTIGLMAGLPTLEPELEQGWIAVVNGAATSSNGDVTAVTRVSGACLEAARWCITADGTWAVASSTSNTSYSLGTGTSYASPTVAGSLALLAQAFPALTPHQLRLRLFATADSDFTGFTRDQVVTLLDGYQSAVSNEFGHGFLDVQAALLPIGPMTINVGGGQTITPNQPLVMSGSASGGAIAASLAGVQVHATDEFAGAFSLDADTLVQSSTPGALFPEQFAAVEGRNVNDRALSSALFDRDPTLQNSFGDLYVASYLPQNSGSLETAGFSVGQRHATSFGHIDWQAGIGSDNGALLPMWQNQDGQDLASLGLAMTSALSENSALQVSAVMATSAGRGNTSSIFMNSSEISYTQAQVFDRNDRLKLSLRQPFAITSGSTNLTLATNSGGTYQLQTFAVDLSPAKREMQIALDYEIEVQRDTDVMLSLVHAMNRGHQAGKEESGVFFGYRKSF